MKHSMILLILLSLFAGSMTAFSQTNPSMEKIDVYVVYDLDNNNGLVIYNVSFTQTLYNTLVELPLFSNNITIINVTDYACNPLFYKYFEENRSIVVLVNESSKISITYELTNAFNEVSVNLYSGTIDLSMYEGLPITFTLTLSGTYNVSTDPQEAIIRYENGFTTIEMNKPQLYIVTIWRTIQVPPTSSATSPTSVAPTSSPYTTPSQATLSPSSTTHTETVVQGAPYGLIALVVIVIVVLIVVAIWLRKK